MKLSQIVAASVAAFAISAASAAPIAYTPGSLVNYNLNAGSFVEYSFSIGQSDLLGETFTVFSTISLDLFKVGTPSALTPTDTYAFVTPIGAFQTFEFDNLVAGNYIAKITNNGPLGANGYFKATVTPVPEAESIALALAGLGVVGAVAARRRKQ